MNSESDIVEYLVAMSEPSWVYGDRTTKTLQRVLNIVTEKDGGYRPSRTCTMTAAAVLVSPETFLSGAATDSVYHLVFGRICPHTW